MAQPTINAGETMNGLAKYNLTAPTLPWCHPRQPLPSKIVGLSDAGWAACHLIELRLHTLDAGRHPIFAGTTAQAVISLSPGDSEFYAAVDGACRTLGLAVLMLDLDFRRPAELCMDNTAAERLASRRHLSWCDTSTAQHCGLQQPIARRQDWVFSSWYLCGLLN